MDDIEYVQVGLVDCSDSDEIESLRKENAALLVAIEAKDAALRETNKYLDQTYTDLIGNLGSEWLASRIVDALSPMLSKAIKTNPSAELLEARDRKRDAKLLHHINGTIYNLDTNKKLFELADSRESALLPAPDL